VTCDETREHLGDHLLGTLQPDVDMDVRRHLRGCASCRAEMAALAEGVSTLAAAAHDVAPPRELRGRVLAVLNDEWSDAEPATSRPRTAAWLGRVAAVAVLAGTVGWATLATIRAADLEDDAGRYRAFVDALGGEDVRAAEFRPSGPGELDGDVVIYESERGPSWVLVLVRAPGREEPAYVTMLAGERQIDLRPMEFGPGGDGSTWLVTSSDLTAYDTVNLWDDAGLIATAEIERS
jgi:anti-sigma factor RsiW